MTRLLTHQCLVRVGVACGLGLSVAAWAADDCGSAVEHLLANPEALQGLLMVVSVVLKAVLPVIFAGWAFYTKDGITAKLSEADHQRLEAAFRGAAAPHADEAAPALPSPGQVLDQVLETATEIRIPKPPEG